MSDPLWNYTKLLMHCDGIEGSLRVFDERHAALSLSGNIAISTLEKKFGGASVRLDGSGDYAFTTSGIAAYAINAGTDFAIEFFAFPRDTANTSPAAFVVGNALGASAVWVGYDWSTAAGKWGFFSGNTSVTTPVLVSTSSVVYDQWVHIAVTRSSNTVRLFINGVIEATATIAGSLAGGSPLIYVGGSSPANQYFGYLDEIRYTVGVARYTADFTPPTAPFEQGDPVYDADYDKVVLHSHLDGEHNGTTFTDRKGHAVTGTGVVKTSTAQKKFGGASCALSGFGIKVNSPDFIFGAADFTIEWFDARTANTGLQESYVEIPNAAGADFGLHLRSPFGGMATLRINGADVATFANAGGNSVYNHYMLVREGATIALFKAGNRVGTYNIGTTELSQNGELYFGKGTIGSLTSGSGTGTYIDEIRITKGLARVSPSVLAFTPPSEPFPDYMPQRLTGTVRDSAGNPISRTVRSYRASDGLHVDSAVSDSVTGGFSLRATDLTEHFVVVHDPVKNALVYDHITPVL